MGLWNSAQNAVELASATVRALSIIEILSRSGRPREALAVTRAIVLAMIEGYQGRVRGEVLFRALDGLRKEMDAENGNFTATMLDRFAAALV